MLTGGQEGSGKCLVVNEVLIATRARWSGTHSHNTRHPVLRKVRVWKASIWDNEGRLQG